MDMLNTGEASQLLRTPAATLEYWRYTGQGPRWFKIGRRVYYDRAEIEAWVAQQKAAA